MKPRPLTPLDAAWLPLLAASEALLDLVRAVLAAGSPLVRPGQEQLRRAAASGLAELGLDRFERDGVRIVLVPARTVPDGAGGEVVVAASYVRVSLDRKARVVTLERRPLAKVRERAA